MSSKSFSSIVLNVYNYLSFKEINRNPEIDLMIDECLKEIEDLESFKYIFKEYKVEEFSLNNKAYDDLLNGCSSFYYVCTTLGRLVDREINKYSKTNLAKMVVYDACASAYLEYMADLYEKNLGTNNTYRFCPGYSGTDLSDIREIFKYIKPEKIGVSLLESNLMTPTKTMIGIIGKGKEAKKSCKGCFMNGNCEYRKENKLCYSLERK